jgi:hypothetical protein
MELLLPILFGCLMLNTLAGFILTGRTLNKLRDRHASVWTELGCPTLIVGNSPAAMSAFLRFLWRRSYLPLADEDLTTNCNRLRLIHVLQLLIFTGAILFLFSRS